MPPVRPLVVLCGLVALVLLSGLAACGDGSRRAAGDGRDQSPEERGRRVYLTYCALCHGTAADGRGVRAEHLRGDPTDFTDPAWRRQATPESVRRAIVEGVPGTSMMPWVTLPTGDVDALVAYLLSVAERPSAADSSGLDLAPSSVD